MTAFGRSRASLVLVATALLCLACNETRTPTEPASPLIGAIPTPTPTAAPTPIPQPASLSGTFSLPYGSPQGGAGGILVECQGRATTTSSGGAYSLTGLMSGKATVRLTVNWPPVEVYSQDVDLKPGMNTFDLGLF